MWTIEYKGYFIHGYCDRVECMAMLLLWSKKCKSLHAAKLAITNHIKENAK